MQVGAGIRISRFREPSLFIACKVLDDWTLVWSDGSVSKGGQNLNISELKHWTCCELDSTLKQIKLKAMEDPSNNYGKEKKELELARLIAKSEVYEKILSLLS